MRFIPFAILIIALVSCSSMQKIDSYNNGEKVQLKQGAKLQLKIAGNPTTGYQWQVLDVDENILALEREPNFVSDFECCGRRRLLLFPFRCPSKRTNYLKTRLLTPMGNRDQPD